MWFLGPVLYLPKFRPWRCTVSKAMVSATVMIDAGTLLGPYWDPTGTLPTLLTLLTLITLLITSYNWDWNLLQLG